MSTIKGQYSGQKSLFFPHPRKSGKTISSLFFAVFLKPRAARKPQIYRNRLKIERNGAKRRNFDVFEPKIAQND